MTPEIVIYQIDAFTDRPFAGNPAAVCPLDAWLPDALMQAIAAENNLSETAFFVPEGEGFHLRWFTPVMEVDLCGHATLASAFVLFTEIDPRRSSVAFATRSGTLTVTRDGDVLTMDFPTWAARAVPSSDALVAALGATPSAVVSTRDLIAVFDDAETVRNLRPDMARVAALDAYAVAVTAPGTGGDADVAFVSRFFAPRGGIPEDPVTGSSFCSLAPYWAQRLGRNQLRARQVSARGGEVHCRIDGARVHLSGRAVLVLSGRMHLPV